ncbi:efflux RND transporter permease subunit [Halioxenophilus aromaticivorans]|uniref:Efflux pump membrane transporter n=1 Tax=Halioxenophilus aromaticivorans TaxID=1306992 RepID=A0AAV3TXT8_9ALTE
MSQSANDSFRHNKLADYFIARPVFAIVLAIATSLAGILGISTLSVSQYPDIAPTTINVRSTYPGATAAAIENTVTDKIEGAMTGLTGLLYMESTSNDGSATTTLTFDNSVTPQMAQVEVQNKLSNVEAQLPAIVRQQGVNVFRAGSGILLIGALVSPNGDFSGAELADMMATRVQDKVERVEGVGGLHVFGSSYAMRIWLNPNALLQYQLVPQDVISAISTQNTQVTAGSLGASPAVEGQQLRAKIVAQSQLGNVREFENIILKQDVDGSTVRLADVARVELGQENYTFNTRFNGWNSSGFAVQLASGANALTTSQGVHDVLDNLAGTLPPGVQVEYAFETTPFVETSIARVLETIVVAIGLVFSVLLLFLQNLRATLIPVVAIPVVLFGTLGVLAVLGYSINMLTLFALVLAIGLLVDDAIVVVENVQRLMDEERLPARAATQKSMGQITGALIGTSVVLVTVVTPMALFPGSVGIIYRQFSITIAVAIVFSTLVAILLTPAMCANLLKRQSRSRPSRWFGWFNRSILALTNRYTPCVGWLLVRPLRVCVVFIILIIGTTALFKTIPTSFVPQEDQGAIMTMISLPEGASSARTSEVVSYIEEYFLTQEKDTVENLFAVLGFSFQANGENAAMAFAKLKDFSEREQEHQSADAVAARAQAHFSQIRDANVFVAQPPAIQGLGNSGGISFYLDDITGAGQEAIVSASQQLAGMAFSSPAFAYLRSDTQNLVSQFEINIDQEKTGALGIDLSALNALISTVFAGSYVNDFDLNGEIKPVYVQGDVPYRMQPDNLNDWYARNTGGEMVPLTAISNSQWSLGAPSLSRINGTRAIKLDGVTAPGVGSGDAMQAMESMVAQLPQTYNITWIGQSFQERIAGDQSAYLYAISLVFVFLCLAALYESWSIPFAVMLVVPVGVFGATLAAWLFNQFNDVYFKVGLLITMGLASRNAILIVEFAKELYLEGIELKAAILEACRLRLRPILMTALTFILGVLPLALASGASANSQNSVGIGILGGMLASTILGILFAPVFFIVVAKFFPPKPLQQ